MVVPGLTQSGGVPAVARFIKDVILRSCRYELKLVSLPMSADDPESVRLCAPHSWLRGVTTTTGIWEGSPFVHVGAVASEFEFQRYRPRSALIKALDDCDLIQVVCGSPAWTNAVVGLGKPVAMHVATRARVERRRRDSKAEGLLDRWRRVMTEITDEMDDRGLRKANAVLVMNPWMLEYAGRINSGRTLDLRYAPPGVDAELFRPDDCRESVKDKYVLCVARLDDPRKNVSLLLEAYAQLSAAMRDEVRLVLAGSAPPPDNFWQRAGALGVTERISFVQQPSRDELIRLYQKASVFALPSDEEGFGVVVVEAMACAVPVISTRSGGPDGIITDGDDGFLVNLDDTLTLAARLIQLLQDETLNIQMGRKARMTIERRYDERVAGEVFLDVWDRLLASRALSDGRPHQGC